LLGYQLEKKTPFGQWEKVSETPIMGESATVPGLTEGEEYEYRVAAVTDAGVGEFSNATPPVKAERKKRKHSRLVPLPLPVFSTDLECWGNVGEYQREGHDVVGLSEKVGNSSRRSGNMTRIVIDVVRGMLA